MPEAAGPEVVTGASLLDELILTYMPESLAWWIAWPFALLGLALCLLGYYAYRLVIALAAGVSGGAVVVIAGPDLLALEGTALLTTAGGAAMILLVLGSVFYRASVFIVGAGIGFGIGAVFWFLVSGDVEPGGGGLTLSGWNRFQIVVGSLVPAVAIGIIFLSWERRLMTLSTVIIGAGLMLFGLRYSGLPLGAREWTPLLAGAAIVAGLWLSLRREGQQPDEPEQRDEPSYYFP